jgi:hypothetical protein
MRTGIITICYPNIHIFIQIYVHIKIHGPFDKFILKYVHFFAQLSRACPNLTSCIHGIFLSAVAISSGLKSSDKNANTSNGACFEQGVVSRFRAHACHAGKKSRQDNVPFFVWVKTARS